MKADMSYYDEIGVAETADTSEIVDAVDSRYNMLRQDVSHPNAEQRRLAESQLERLEKIRSVLTDPTERANYDALLSASVAGGLSDPSATTPQQQRTPPPPRTPADRAPTSTDVIVCPNCRTENSIDSRHCLKCGTALVGSCPNCGRDIPVNAVHCPRCGVNIADFKLEQEATEAIKLEEAQRLAEQRAALRPLQEKANSASTWTTVGCVAGFFVWILAIPLWYVGYSKAGEVLNSAPIPGDEAIRSKASRVRTWATIGLVLGVASVAMSCFYFFGMSLLF